jgi:hypothetical protein
MDFKYLGCKASRYELISFEIHCLSERPALADIPK